MNTVQTTQKEKKVLDEQERLQVRAIAALLHGVFVWRNSREGGQYWAQLWIRLMQLSEDGEL